MGRKRRNEKVAEDEDDGFAQWGGYMNAKKFKLTEQFQSDSTKYITKITDIFKNVAIFINGFTHPSAEELKILMAQHGGIYQTYQMPNTTHIIASNLPNVKIKQLGNVPIIKPQWITDSIANNKLLDYKKYILYTNESVTQPKLNFQKVDINNSIKDKDNTSVLNISENKKRVVNQKYTKTASDPNFLEEFYNNSRLHLISTLGAEFKQLVNKLREGSNGIFPGRENLMKNKNLSQEKDFSSGKIIMHIDMDCFFVSVGLRSRPDLKNKPVAVTHARNGRTQGRPGLDRSVEIDLYKKRLPEGAVTRLDHIDSHSSMSEIASCSYEARKFGIKNGMFLGTAVKLCPDIKTIPYDFQAYKDVSTILYNTIASYTLDIEAVSCDEMYVDVTDILKSTNLSVNDWATHIRNEIMEKTGCPCSTGFGENRLQARLATRSAKPAGQFYLSPENVGEYMHNILLSDLPGVGYATLAKLNKLELRTCGDAQGISLKTLQFELGNKNGETLYDQVRGIDKVPLSFTHERKSVSAEVNYGIRFKSLEEAHNFLKSLSHEVFKRLNEINMRSKCLTLKLMIRSPDAPQETAKFLGHGVCDSINKSTTGSIVLNDPQAIFKEALSLYGKVKVNFADLRGVGIQLTKLEKNTASNQLLNNFLKNSNSKEPKIKEKDNRILISKKESVVEQIKKVTPISMLMNSKNKSSKVNGLPPDSGFDMNVFNELPKSIQTEILKEYKLKTSPVDIPNQSIKNSTKSTINNKKIVVKQKQVTSPFDHMNLEEFRTALKHWLVTDVEPSPVDINMISAYLQQLALSRKIENLKIIFSFLYRNITPLNCKWHAAYYSVINKVQEKIKTVYGAVLRVDTKILCLNCNYL